jgi:hypothetical protein
MELHHILMCQGSNATKFQAPIVNTKRISISNLPPQQHNKVSKQYQPLT